MVRRGPGVAHCGWLVPTRDRVSTQRALALVGMVVINQHRPTAFEVLTTPVTLLVGHFGAGKSEISLNLAMGWRALGWAVTLVDLDVVKPYFRSRLLRDELTAQGIEVVLPEGDRAFADLPIVVPAARAAAGLSADVHRKVILDVGGGEGGARVLGSLRGLDDPAVTDVLFVVNGSRPFAETVPDVVRMLRDIEHTARVGITGLIANTHLIDETTRDVVASGLALARRVADETGLPIRCWAAVGALATEELPEADGLAVLPMTRQITPPIGWRTGGVRRRSSVV